MENLAISMLAEENVWVDKSYYDLAERRYHERKAMDKKMVSDHCYWYDYLLLN